MAQTEIYIYTKRRKSAILVGEAPCDSRGALYLWNSLSKKYLGCEFDLLDVNNAKEVWALYKDKRLTRNERIVLASTFDNNSCKPSNIKELVNALREVNHSLLNSTGNLDIQADLIEKAINEYKDIFCVAILATNTVCFNEICKSKDDTWDIIEDVNDIENNFKD